MQRAFLVWPGLPGLSWSLGKRPGGGPAINKLLRRSSGYHLGCNLQSGLGYFRSSENPEDDATRLVPLRGPAAPLPGWWWDLARGNHIIFQSWLDGQPELQPDEAKFRPEALPEKLPFRAKVGKPTAEESKPATERRPDQWIAEAKSKEASPTWSRVSSRNGPATSARRGA